MHDSYGPLLTARPEWGPLATFVGNKRLPIYNWLYFKEGFSRDLVLQLLGRFGVQKGTVLDPWCGSGTTLLACKERGINAVGIDSLPIALLASRVKTADHDTTALAEAASDLFSRRFELVSEPCPYRKFFSRHTLEDVLFFRREIASLEDGVREFFLLALVSSAIRASWMHKDGNMLKVRQHPVPPFRKFFRRWVKTMIRHASAAEGKGVCRVLSGDPRTMPLDNDVADAVITSPPYLNQIDYRKMYALENWILGEDRGPEPYLTSDAEERYVADLGAVLRESWRVCRPGACLAIVVANAYFPQDDRVVESDFLLAAAGEQAGFAVTEIAVVAERHALQRRTIQRGTLRESVVMLRKP